MRTDAIQRLVDFALAELSAIQDATAGREGADWNRPDADKVLTPMWEGIEFNPLRLAALAVAANHPNLPTLIYALQEARSKLLNMAAIYLRPYADDLVSRRVSIGNAASGLDSACHALTLAAHRLADMASVPVGGSSTTIVDIGDRVYEIGGKKMQVTKAEDDTLQAFIDSESLDDKNLKQITKSNRAPRTLRGLRERYSGMFAPAITLPGKRGNGGYVVRITAPK
jgi:hypothetical protein